MQRVMFHSTIFGPIRSRRLGVSLGVNLSPDDGKTCTFDCLYCEAGFNAQGTGTTGLPPRQVVLDMLEHRLDEMSRAGEPLDVITFSGNGEPTIHPEFPEIIDGVIALRDRFYPDAKVSVLSNSTRLSSPRVVEALRRVDNPIMKLDSTDESVMRLIDRPVSPSFSSEGVVDLLARHLSGVAIIQTMLLRGSHDGTTVDNTSPDQIEGLIRAITRIRPRSVMIYSIDRPTPEKDLRRVERDELIEIAEHISSATGVPVSVA
ncbi:MAG: radical SAM protein [Muribaculaceae bacterium]|nr:radical SAM protein [Muribaculaceae bacterium]